MIKHVDKRNEEKSELLRLKNIEIRFCETKIESKLTQNSVHKFRHEIDKELRSHDNCGNLEGKQRIGYLYVKCFF